MVLRNYVHRGSPKSLLFLSAWKEGLFKEKEKRRGKEREKKNRRKKGKEHADIDRRAPQSDVGVMYKKIFSPHFHVVSPSPVLI